jgi:hypothetical protein
LKLIKEVVEDVDYIVEEVDGKKSLFIQGPFLVAEKVNKNGRMYKSGTMQKEVNRYMQEVVSKNRAYGELGHPDTPALNLHRVSHMIVDLRQEGTNWIGKAKILDTPMGNIAKGLIEGGGQLGVSSRGMGSLKSVNGVSVVQDDFRLATAADIVADPSAPGAFVEGIMEGKEWMLINGVWTEADQEAAMQTFKHAPKRLREDVKLKIFKDFIRKL